MALDETKVIDLWIRPELLIVHYMAQDRINSILKLNVLTIHKDSVNSMDKTTYTHTNFTKMSMLMQTNDTKKHQSC